MQQTERRTTTRTRTALAGVVALAVTTGCVLASGAPAMAANGNTTVDQVAQDFTDGLASIALGGDIDTTGVSGSRSTTLTLAKNTGPTGRTVLDLRGHVLAVQAVQLTTFDSGGSPVGATLRIVDSVGGGVLRVVQTDGSVPAVEVDSVASLEVLSGTLDATGAPGSAAAVVGGGTTANASQASGSISTNSGGRIVATGSGSGAAIGSGEGAGAGSLAFGGGSTVIATNAGTGAAIGDGNGVASASILIANQATRTSPRPGPRRRSVTASSRRAAGAPSSSPVRASSSRRTAAPAPPAARASAAARPPTGTTRSRSATARR